VSQLVTQGRLGDGSTGLTLPQEESHKHPILA
jgi:hypothetical protein